MGEAGMYRTIFADIIRHCVCEFWMIVLEYLMVEKQKSSPCLMILPFISDRNKALP